MIAGPEPRRACARSGRVLTSALLIGIASATTKIAVAYAKDRSQFGRPIGSFQGLQFMLADAHARTEIARASLHAAGLTVDDPDIGDIDRAASRCAGARGARRGRQRRVPASRPTVASASPGSSTPTSISSEHGS